MLQQYINFCMFFSSYRVGTVDFDTSLFYAEPCNWKPFFDYMCEIVEDEERERQKEYDDMMAEENAYKHFGPVEWWA